MSFSRSLKDKAKTVWEDGYHHPFLQELGQGTLDKETFQFYLLQDYQYLLDYARVFALGVLKADSEALMRRLSDMQATTLAEMDMHREYMRGFGVSQREMEQVQPSLFNRTYTANMLATGYRGGIAEILATVFPCAWTYADYSQRLAKDFADKLEGNFFRSWIETYASPEFSASFEWFYDALDEHCAEMSAAQLKKIEDIFIASVEFEYLFWDMSYKRQMSYR